MPNDLFTSQVEQQVELQQQQQQRRRRRRRQQRQQRQQYKRIQKHNGLTRFIKRNNWRLMYVM